MALTGLVLIVYWPVQHHDFLVWDDFEYVVENPHVRSGLSLRNVLWAFTTVHASYWHPITWLSHMLDCTLYGLNPRGHHFNNVLIHLGSTLLLFSTLKKMTGAPWRSAFAAALFSLHPLRIESVAWIAERKDVLAAFFWVLTIRAYCAYARRGGKRAYLLTMLSFSLGLAAKQPAFLTLPFALLLLDYWPLERIGFRPFGSGDEFFALRKETPFAGLLAEKLPLFLLALLSSLITYFAAGQKGAVAGLEAVPFDLRLANALVSYASYLEKTIWPSDLAFFYPYPQGGIPFPRIALSFLLMAGITFAVLVRFRQIPYLGVGWLWFLGTLVPAIGLVQVGSQAMADRFTYLPHIGLAVSSVWGLDDLTRRLKNGRTFFLAGAGLLIVACSISTSFQLVHWRSGITLFSQALRVTPGNYTAQYLLGNEHAIRGDTEKAVSHYREALRMKPDYFPAIQNLGSVLLLLGRTEEAVLEYRKAIRIRPGDKGVLSALGNALLLKGDYDEAVSLYRSALLAEPSDSKVHTNLGFAFLKAGRNEEAVRQFEEALRVNPSDPKAAHNLGVARQRLKKPGGGP